ncbi:hypothetical protein ACKA0G_28980 [Priestia megaterium]
MSALSIFSCIFSSSVDASNTFVKAEVATTPYATAPAPAAAKLAPNAPAAATPTADVVDMAAPRPVTAALVVDTDLFII